MSPPYNGPDRRSADATMAVVVTKLDNIEKILADGVTSWNRAVTDVSWLKKFFFYLAGGTITALVLVAIQMMAGR